MSLFSFLLGEKKKTASVVTRALTLRLSCNTRWRRAQRCDRRKH